MNWSVPQISMPIESPAITPGIEPLPEASFYIPATEPTTRLRPRSCSHRQWAHRGAGGSVFGDRVVVLSALRRRSHLFPPAGGRRGEGFLLLQGMVDFP